MEKQKLFQTVWKIANDFRGKTGGNLLQLKDYLFAFIFYKQLSHKSQRFYASEIGIEYKDDLEFNTKFKNQNKYTIEELEDEQKEMLGFFIKPDFLWYKFIQKIKHNFEISYIEEVFNDLSKNSINNKMEGLFEDLNFNSSDLGREQNDKKSVLQFLILSLENIDFDLGNIETDLIGDLFEYLLATFSSESGKAGGQFYTPQCVASLLAQLATVDKDPKITVYDPACGSGGLLLNIVKNFGIDNIDEVYGQELNHKTFNLARMNMFLRMSKGNKFTLYPGDTLNNSQIPHDKKFTSIVANPPYGVSYEPEKIKASNSPIFNNILNNLPSKSNGEILFLHHMIHHLSDDGTAAVVLPTGVNFRGSEKPLRKRYVDLDYIDTIIMLPSNMFYGTNIETFIYVVKKCKDEEMKNKIRFIDTRLLGKTVDKQKKFSQEDINKIVDTFRNNSKVSEEDIQSYFLTRDEIVEKDYTLDINSYLRLPRNDIPSLEESIKNNEEIMKKLNLLFEKIKENV
ncbi:MAG: type I restriction-modification system subunit M [Candidatus Tyloplasma litorale]|nr:MAG: type I restriction-modification system subunit M [Mycoplasmatales bacterium]